VAAAVRAVAAVALLAGGCSTGSDGESAVEPHAATTSPDGPTTTAGLGSLPFDPVALGAVRVVATFADGTTREWCLLVADDAPERSQGLMFVTDPALGGYDGMVFAYPEPTSGSFWMRNTRVPLTITFVAADGRPVGTVAMEPCPDESPSCPTYGPDAAYRWAIEVPTDRVDEVGLAAARTIEVTAEPCTT
jgi:uncharacterized membrane protein (UPF0127 family)